MTSINGLRAVKAALSRLDLSAEQHEALERAAQQLETSVKQSLSHDPGDDHRTPWKRTGALRDSITHSTDDAGAVIGSSDPVAVYQELGTRQVPPRPFLVPTAAVEAEPIAQAIAAAFAEALEKAVT